MIWLAPYMNSGNELRWNWITTKHWIKFLRLFCFSQIKIGDKRSIYDVAVRTDCSEIVSNVTREIF